MIVLLWRHVIRRADVRLGQVPHMVQNLADTEISQPDVSFQHEDVGRFQVSVQNFLLMHVKNGQSDLSQPVHNFIFRYLVALHRLNELIHIAAFAVLHDDVKEAFFVDERVTIRNDADVIELLQEFDFIEDVLLFLFAFVFDIDLLDDVLLFL